MYDLKQASSNVPAKVTTIALKGIEAIEITVQVQISSGLPSFVIVGLADKAISESRERIRSSLLALGLSLPPKRIVVSLAPAAIPKEGSHYDLAIILGLLTALGIVEQELISSYVAMGELALDGSLTGVAGVLPAAMWANEKDKSLICPDANGGEAKLSGLDDILAPRSLADLLAHLVEGVAIQPVKEISKESAKELPDISDIRGQESAKRALEIAAAGGHNLLMIGPPGSGKSMLAERLIGILPDLTSKEALEISLIHSVIGYSIDISSLSLRPFRSPHHTASTPSIVGGGTKARPGEISLSHCGVLFMDEFPEFSRQTLEALRQPLEKGEVSIARVNHNVTYPANFQLVAAMNPCRCGYFGDTKRQCKQTPICALKYQEKLSGPLLDRLDIFVHVSEVRPQDLATIDNKDGENSKEVRKRTSKARDIQKQRFQDLKIDITTNAMLESKNIEENTKISAEAKKFLLKSSEFFDLTARSWFRTIKVARTIADLEASETVEKSHIAEALSYRRFFIKQ